MAKQPVQIGEVKIFDDPSDPLVFYTLQATVNGKKYSSFANVTRTGIKAGENIETKMVGEIMGSMSRGLLTGVWEHGGTPLSRMRAELADLDEKYSKLDAFISGEVYATLPHATRSDLCEQHKHMEAYTIVLRRRIVKMEAKASD